MRLFLLSLSALALSSSASAQWSVGAGGTPNRDCRSTANGPASPDILWQGSDPAIVAQQAVVDQGIAVMARITSFTIPTGTTIVAHDLATGSELWSTQLPMNFPDSWRSRVSGFRDGRVYVTRAGNTNAEYLYALDPVDGSVLWESEDLITETSTESVSYTSNGDLITTGVDSGGGRVIHRIDATDGTTVWSLPRLCPTSGGCDISVFNDRGYYWEPEPGPSVKLSVADLTTGTKLYSVVVSGGFIQQVAPFVGPDGTVYAPRSVNNSTLDFLHAYEDTGAGFVEKWNVPIGYIPFATHAVGPDGSVYAYSRNYTILRLDPATGAILDESPVYANDGGGIQGRMAVDPSGRLFFTNGEFAVGRVYCYSADLQVLWDEAILNVNVGGPAIGADGTMIVCGVGTDVRAYKSDCGDVYCDGNPDNAADISIDGCACASGSIMVEMTGAPAGQFGYLLIGAGSGIVTNPPGAQGDLCLGGSAIGRYTADAAQTDGAGALATDVLNASSAGGGGNIPTIGGNLCSSPGQSWNFQYWHRDGQNPSRFSKAISVTFK